MKNVLKRLVLFVMIASLLSGCRGIKLGYNNLDRYLTYKIDSYFDLTQEQEKILDRDVENLLVWHRQYELPHYIAYLTKVKQLEADGVSEQDVSQVIEGFQLLKDQLVMKLIPVICHQALHLTSEQLAHFQDQLAEDNQAKAEEYQLPPKKRMRHRKERTIDSFEDWVGALNRQQVEIIENFVEGLPDLTDDWLKSREQEQSVFLQQLADPAKRIEQVEQTLADLWLSQGKWNRESDYQAKMNLVLTKYRTFIPIFYQTVTDKQRLYFIERLDRIVTDFRELQADE